MGGRTYLGTSTDKDQGALIILVKRLGRGILRLRLRLRPYVPQHSEILYVSDGKGIKYAKTVPSYSGIIYIQQNLLLVMFGTTYLAGSTTVGRVGALFFFG